MTDASNQPNHESDQSTEAATTDEANVVAKFKPLRIWPAILFLIGMAATRSVMFTVEDFTPMLGMIAFFGPIAFGALLLFWWLFASRATVAERIVGFVGVIIVAAATMALMDKSMHGPGVMMITLPMGLGLFGLSAILVSRMVSFKRTAIIILCSLLGFGYSTLLRSDGMWGDASLGLFWRWSPTAEDVLLADSLERPQAALSNLADEQVEEYLLNPQWPAFRGAYRDSRQQGITLSTDWSADVSSPLWKVPVGPGWSSFVVAGDFLFTQEQRGEAETIVCYDANSGGEVWRQQINTRFYDPLGGPGPRATPTLAGGKLFTLGGNGHLLRLEPKNGKVVWQQDIRDVSGRQPPEWGFSSSPLVVDSVVIVYAGGAGDKGTLAFDIESGELKWSAPAGDHSYSSATLMTVAGQPVVAMLTNMELSLLNPADGTVLVNYAAPFEGYRALQPQVVDGDSILFTTGMGGGMQRVRITNNDGQWSAERVWVSRHMKPDFNDFVVYQGHAYGFNGATFTCIDLADGKRKWRGGRYGRGQVLLLDSGQLLVVSEKGDVVLLKADPSAHTELTRFQALEGKTWNHPVLIGDRLFVRNSQEAAAFRLPVVN